MPEASIQTDSQTFKPLIKEKLKAVSIHFSLSLTAFIILLYFILFEWYPYPFFTATGGRQGLNILAAVDLILGPLLTLIIFNPSKSLKETCFDFSCIGIIQISAMLWGLHNIYQQHTAAVVFWENAFYAVPYKLYKQQNISLADIKAYSDHHPPVIYAKFPKNLQAVKKLQQKAAEGIPAFAHIDIYHKIDSYYDRIFQHKLDIHEIISNNSKMKTDLEEFLTANNSHINDYIYMGLKAKFHNIIFIYKDKKIVSTLNAPYLKNADK